MFFGLLVSIFVAITILLIFLILVQKGKGSSGLGGLGGGTQMLFGGSGGQDIFQKITWGLGITFMALSLGLSYIKAYKFRSAKYLDPAKYGKVQESEKTGEYRKSW